MVSIDISAFSEGLHEIVLHPDAEDLDLDPNEFSEIETRVRLDIGDRQILCRIDASADAGLICDRTLEPFVERIAGDFTVVFTKDPEEESEGEIAVLDAASSSIDVTEYVRDTLVLSVPVRKVAPTAGEAVLTLQFGGPATEEDAIDPRWDALRKLRTGS